MNQPNYRRQILRPPGIAANGCIEHRTLAVGDLRAAAAVGGGRSIARLTGHAAPFNSNSRPIAAGSSQFRERIIPGAFAKALAAGNDIRALYDHQKSAILGRTSARTLSVNEDRIGLAFALDLPDTCLGRDTLESVRRGDLRSLSFGFNTIADQWTRAGDGMLQRTLTEVNPFEISLTSTPAYEDTDVQIVGEPLLRKVDPDFERRRQQLEHEERELDQRRRDRLTDADIDVILAMPFNDSDSRRRRLRLAEAQFA